MTTASPTNFTIEAAMAHHRQGRLSEAERLYRSVLIEDPDQFDALHLLGIIKLQQQNASEAVTFLTRAVTNRPQSIDALCNLSAAFLDLKRYDEAVAACDRVLSGDALSTEALFNRAAALSELGREQEALDCYGKLLASKPGHANALFRRCMLLARMSRYDAALADCDRIIALAPDHVDALNNRGNILLELGRLAEALASYDRALALVPTHPNLLKNRGIVLRRMKRFDDAIAMFDRVLTSEPGDVAALSNKGAALLDCGRAQEALACFDAAIRREPNDPELLDNRGLAQYALNRIHDALASYDLSLRFGPGRAETLHNRGAALAALDLHTEALESYQRSLAIRPANADVLYNCGASLALLNDWKEAVARFEAALAVEPDHANAQFGACMAQLPILYETDAEIIERRGAYERRLKTLCEADLSGGESLIDGVGSFQPFYLAQQGQNDRELQQAYGSLICRLMARRFPMASLPDAPRPDEPIRLGIVSGFFWWHSNWKIPIKGWISQLDRRRFSIFGYHTGKVHDTETDEAAACCDRFLEGPRSIAQWREAILADAPHVLIHPEIGMDAVAVQLAAQRLAPVQCGSWGHPETTGLPTIDYFLSSDLMEPPDADDHYSERLVRLPNLSIYYEPVGVAPAAVSRERLGLRDSSVAYWCGQSLFKYLPQYDQVFPRIAREVEDCQFIFIGYQKGGPVTEQFRERLNRSFVEFGFESAAEHCVFLPRLEPDRFLGAIGHSDIVLDSIGWSGCNSILETLAYDLPVVTMPGSLMRGRHGIAILTMMGVEETIADDLDTYVSTAVRLGRDSGWRKQISARIALNKHRVYRDRESIAALESFLEDAVRHR